MSGASSEEMTCTKRFKNPEVVSYADGRRKSSQAEGTACAKTLRLMEGAWLVCGLGTV